VKPDLSEAVLPEESLEGANLSAAFLYSAILTYAHLDNANLSGSDLTGANLDGAILDGASLRNANLRKAHLTGSSLYYTDLSGTKMIGAYLDKAILRGANLAGADLAAAVLTRASLIKVKLDDANLSGVTMAETAFCDVDLRQVSGLDTAEHLLPSTIGIDTIIRSSGQIPVAFLRGAGIPDVVIDDIPSLVAESEYYSCFIAYSSGDEEFARRLFKDLQDNGVRCYFAKEHMRVGDRIRATLEQRIHDLDKMLLILSKYSIQSDWVEKEVETAFDRERVENKTVLIPIRVDEAVMDTDQAWARDIRRTRHIGDFGRWDSPNAYQHAFKRLLRDLRTTDTEMQV
jgi:hypothetical protein